MQNVISHITPKSKNIKTVYKKWTTAVTFYIHRKTMCENSKVCVHQESLQNKKKRCKILFMEDNIDGVQLVKH